MPAVWTRIMTPARLERLRDDPVAFKREVHRTVTAEGAGLDEVYWGDDGSIYALIHIPGRSQDASDVAERVAAALEAEESISLQTVEELS
jgi:hypothetical protein